MEANRVIFLSPNNSGSDFDNLLRFAETRNLNQKQPTRTSIDRILDAELTKFEIDYLRVLNLTPPIALKNFLVLTEREYKKSRTRICNALNIDINTNDTEEVNLHYLSILFKNIEVETKNKHWNHSDVDILAYDPVELIALSEASIRRAFEISDNKAETSRLFNEMLEKLHSELDLASQASVQAAMPTSPPGGITYDKRLKGESAPDFISRIYGRWLTGEFTRANLKKIDEPAYRGLYNWERKHGRANLNLPTKPERTDHIIKTVGQAQIEADLRESERVRAGAAYRQRRHRASE